MRRFLIAFGLGFIGTLAIMVVMLLNSGLPSDQIPLNGYFQLPTLSGLCAGLAITVFSALRGAADKGARQGE
jgi:hypothetical protein